MAGLIQDLRYGLRVLGKAPGFTAVAVITLGLGIAANATIFSAVSAVLLRKPPVKDPGRLMMILSVNRSGDRGSFPESPASVPDFIDWRAQNHVFEKLGIFDPWNNFSLAGNGEPENVSGMRVSSNYFDLLGVSAALGHAFLPGEDHPGHEYEVILSHELWKNHFGSNPHVVGTTVKLSDQVYTIIGVMPEKFALWSFQAQIWVPLVFKSEQLSTAGRASRFCYVVGRLEPGVPVEKAQAEMETIAAKLGQVYPTFDKNWDAKVISLQEWMILEAHVRPALMFLMGAVGFVLLIACANIAGLLLVRGAARHQELAIRTALGAGRFRLVRQFLTESVLIALMGGAFGLLLANWGMHLLQISLDFNEVVSAWKLSLDARVLLFTSAISLACVLLFGLIPALQGSKSDVQTTLKEGGRTGTAGAGRGRIRRVFVICELALALVLLTGAGLMIKNFFEALTANPGFNPRQLLTARISLASSRYGSPSKQEAFFRNVTERIRELPGVVSAATTTTLPLSAEPESVSFSVEGAPWLPPDKRPQAPYYVIGPDYLRTMEIPVIQGRALTKLDKAGAPPVVLVNEAFARRLFPQGDALGQHIAIDTDKATTPVWREIVGVAGNVKDWFGQAGFNPQIYAPDLQAPSAEMTFVVRTRSDPAALASELRRAVWSVDKDQPIGSVMTMTDMIRTRGGAGDQLMGELLGIFASLALLLAAVGVYGIIAYSVRQRTHEMGIRMALGAEGDDVLKLVVEEGMRLAGIGILIGLAPALALPSLLARAFPGFSVHAAPVFVSVPVLVAAVSLLASYVPARWASCVDPMVALRHE